MAGPVVGRPAGNWLTGSTGDADNRTADRARKQTGDEIVTKSHRENECYKIWNKKRFSWLNDGVCVTQIVMVMIRTDIGVRGRGHETPS